MAAHMPSRLYRSRSQKMIAGVSGGLGDYFDVDPVLIRLLFVVTAFISGVGILAYIVLWIVVPFEGDDSPRMDALRRDFDDLSGRVREYVEPMRGGNSAGTGRGASGATPGEPASTAAPTAAPFDAAAPVADAAPAATATRTTTTTSPATAAAGDMSPAAAQPIDEDLLLSRIVAHEEASMTAESVTTSRLPVRYDPASAVASTIDPFGEPLPESPPRISSSTPAPPSAPAGADGPTDRPYTAPGAASFTAASSTAPRSSHHEPQFGPPPYGGAGAAAAAPPERRRRRQHWAGAILIILGLLILVNNLGLLWWVEPEYILPLILVGGGVWLLFGRGRRG